MAKAKRKWTKGPYSVTRAQGHPTDAGILSPTGRWLGVCPKEQADLYAASPELYLYALAADEALSNVCEPVKDSNNPLEALRWNLRAVLAKARGEED